MRVLDIVTINTWKGAGDYRNRIQHLAETLKNLDPDIIVCQECFRCHEKNADSLLWLSQTLGMDYNYLPARNKKRFFENEWVDSESGLGMLSKHKIVSSHSFDLPAVPNDDERKTQLVQLKTKSGWEFVVCNVHLTHIETKEDHRLMQINQLAAVLNSEPQLPYFVCGDFNLSPSSLGIALFKASAGLLDCCEPFFELGQRYSLVDAFMEGKKICVDYVFCPIKFVGENRLKIKNASVVLDLKDSKTGNYPSDHFGIHITVEIPD